MNGIGLMVKRYWKVGVVVFVLGIILGAIGYLYAFHLAIEGMEKRKHDTRYSGFLPYSISFANTNIRGKETHFCRFIASQYAIMEVRSMTKKEAMVKLKGAWRTAQTTTKMKVVKDLYTEVKNLDTPDSAQIPANVEQKVTSV